MRKLIIAVVLLITANTIAQEDKVLNTINVTGSVKFKKNVTGFKVKLKMSLDQMGYGNTDCNSLDELKEKYFDKLKENGVDPSKLEEKSIEYLSMFYQRDGTIFYYEARTEEEVSKLLNVRMNGVSNNGLEYKMELDDAVYDGLIEKALKQAEEKANRIAEKANKKVGKIAMITDNSSAYNDWVYYSPRDEYFQLNVVFELL